MWRSVTVGCGNQALGEGFWRFVSKCRMWAVRIVVMCPVTNCDPSMHEVTEHGFVEQLVPYPPVKAFDKPILHRLSGRNVVPIDLVIETPAQHRIAGQFCAIIADDHPWLSTSFNKRC